MARKMRLERSGSPPRSRNSGFLRQAINISMEFGRNPNTRDDSYSKSRLSALQPPKESENDEEKALIRLYQRETMMTLIEP
ncbi:MAG: hypothetical protein M1812_007796 [Candelaria pacifica]|nr:MAG: hypothetical protein M1812_007796 [Candelaria pacifica]